jgi:hypothetical protein
MGTGGSGGAAEACCRCGRRRSAGGMGAASRIRVWRRPLLRALLVSFVACWCDCASEAEAKTVRDARPRRRPSAMQLLGLGNWASPCLGGSACRPAGLG